MRAAYVRIASFSDIGHLPVERDCMGQRVIACDRCGCFDGSYNSRFPCGDILGSTVHARPSIRDGQHANDMVWRGVAIGYLILDCAR